MIPHASRPRHTIHVADNENDHLVISILASLGKDALSFERASKLYNSDFFRTESVETKTRLCTALSDHFAPNFQNSFWNTNRQQGT